MVHKFTKFQFPQKTDSLAVFSFFVRQGIGLSGGPWYVVAKEIKDNIVYISRNYYSGDKVRDRFAVHTINWIAGKRPDHQVLQVKMRHGEHQCDCSIKSDEDGTLQVKLTEHDQGIASGQIAVFYNGDSCLGGGVIIQAT